MMESHQGGLMSLFIFISLVSFSLSESTDISSCLTSRQIQNFTVFPELGNRSSTVYYKFLNFPIQNLRFTAAELPKPIAIVLPETKEQLVSTFLCSQKASLAIRIRCGGHSYEGLSSVASYGVPFVIVDIMNLNRVLVDLESESAWVEAGATLGETYYAIANSSNKHGFTAGSCPTVGSGGHIAGGGFGLLSRKYGLAADNIVDALVINANGVVLDRKSMGEEVFWAIRGGGGGVWGIVYAWKIQLVPVPQNVTAFIVSRTGTKEHIAKLVQKWQFIAPKLEDEFYLSVFVAGLSGTKTRGVSAEFKGFYLGRKSGAISILSCVFPELGVVEEDCEEMSWIESILYFSGLDSGRSISDLRDRYLQSKLYYKAKSDYVRQPIPLRGIVTALNILEEESRGYVILDPYGGMMERISSDSIAFPHREGNLFSIQYLVEWDEEHNEQSDKYIDWIRRFYDSMTPFVSNSPRAAYVNYLDLDLGVMELVNSTTMPVDAVKIARNWGEKYFLNNYDRLIKAKTQFDPSNVFNHQQGIPPLPEIGFMGDLK